MAQRNNNNTENTAETLGLVEYVAGYKSSKLKPGDSLRVHIPPSLSELKRGGYFIVQFRRIDDGTAQLLARADTSNPSKVAKRTIAKRKVEATKTSKASGRKRGSKMVERKVSAKKKTSQRKSY